MGGTLLTAMGVCASDQAEKEQADKVDIHAAVEQGKADEVQLVLAFYPDRVNAKNRDGRTPLHLVAYTNQCEVAKVLIAAGADLKAKNDLGYTPLHYAVFGNQCKVAEILIAAGADPNAKDWGPNNQHGGSTPLDEAKRYNRQEMIK